MIYRDFKKHFDYLPEIDQWGWALERKHLITIYLDNDNTTFYFNGEEDSIDCTIFTFKADIGDRSGVEVLLKILGFEVQSV